MIVNKNLLQELFRGFHIQRWNDRIRPMELLEMDKHAHKMIIAYCIGKYEEERGNVVDWQKIIKGGIYELLRRITISDIKSPIFNDIRNNKDVFRRLNNYIFKELEPIISDEKIKSELHDYLFQDININEINTRILQASHIFASYWEFRIIKNSNPQSYQTVNIETELLNRLDKFQDLIGIQKLTQMQTVSNFVDLFGQLRFQVRWAQLPRIPKTSVLGHSLMVACTSYFFGIENNACHKRLYNDFFGGLFHDLPEAVTRDIISPVKSSSKELELLIKEIEEDLAEKEIYPLVEKNWIDEIKYFTVDEFENKIIVDGKIKKENISTDDLNEKYNKDEFNPYDGKLIRSADHLSAFIEVWNSCNSGIKTDDLLLAVQKIKEKNIEMVFGNVKMRNIYSDYSDFMI